MMDATDRELMELAAKAVGYEILDWFGSRPSTREGALIFGWNPLNDDGDALRLAVSLKLEVGIWFDSTRVESDEAESAVEKHGLDPFAATRLAIVRAAAEIGKATHEGAK